MRLIAVTHTASNMPETTRTIHAMRVPPWSSCRVAGYDHPRPGAGRARREASNATCPDHPRPRWAASPCGSPSDVAGYAGPPPPHPRVPARPPGGPMLRRSRAMRAAAVLGCSTVLAACGAQPDAAPVRASEVPWDAFPEDHGTGSDSRETRCGPTHGRQALADSLPLLRPASGDPAVQWTGAASDYSGYAPCAELSWILVADTGDEPTPHQIMLFHRGHYLGTTLYSPTEYHPQVARVDGSTIRVTYPYPQDGDPADTPSGEAVSTFTWDPAQRRVRHEGDLPPGQS
ncbi:hypothetical protein CYJ76_02005 [Kytococcus schroeteri]|uniref:LppP/LprE family lipoprotein n=2 Tax=Kytococcaceae TaxID=2805426 RepID=A0A2I1PDL5_9MICO|nr:hypothetical protein CYJ76_02005 [Kytococcus schroeteri]